MQIFDISVAISAQTPVWPGRPSVEVVTDVVQRSGHAHRNTCLHMDVHAGTHIDSPAHYLSDGAGALETSLARCIGPAQVVAFPGVRCIGERELLAARLEPGVERVLFKTDNGAFWPEASAFRPDYVGLDSSAAEFCAARGLSLVGTDYLSIQAPGAPDDVHRVLLRCGIVVLEGLDLRAVEPGRYELVCLPLKLAAADGAPVRAILRR